MIFTFHLGFCMQEAHSHIGTFETAKHNRRTSGRRHVHYICKTKRVFPVCATTWMHHCKTILVKKIITVSTSGSDAINKIVKHIKTNDLSSRTIRKIPFSDGIYTTVLDNPQKETQKACSFVEEWDIGGFWTPQYRKKNSANVNVHSNCGYT